MSISSRFAVAVHSLTLIEMTEHGKATSEYIAGSVNTNPVVIRRILGMLNKHGLIRTRPGAAGAALARPMEEITMLDIYQAVSQTESSLFAIHDKPNPDCMVGRNIQSTLEHVFTSAQSKMETDLASVTLAQICRQIKNAN